MSGRLQGKRALVTGATSNIGRAIAEAFADEGGHVVVQGRNAERGAEVVDGIRARGGRADFVTADLDGSAESSRVLAQQATSVLGEASTSWSITPGSTQVTAPQIPTRGPSTTFTGST